ncbi:MerR family transcriptional regulator [Paenibacillus taihuensis]|uniref:MerR family transcriptional regulator n=1 Tax=Paenibacillus taihuensis TaxID=1156355 RepID=A0A3D9RV74_9BACL|nr:MerR family transcriptional regulator [Paenibacillus taihuensis]REE83893.1 MerR family transcriptional regulator [Paenibacillus taihuensis]
MYSISDIARLTGITAYTLRYYERIGVLPKPRRQLGNSGGSRQYDDLDLRYIRFIYGLKQTGMTLEDIMSFTKDGCLLTEREEDAPIIEDTLHSRIDILNRHIADLDQRMKQLEEVKAVALEKRAFYSAMLEKLEKADHIL